MQAQKRGPYRSVRAFTLIELMIVVAIIAIVAAIAIPSLISSRVISYETSAIGTLRSLVNAQSTFVTRCIVDQDGDGQGEYGFFRELTGVAVPRTKASRLRVGDVFSGSFGTVDPNGVVGKTGYCFIIYLPTAAGPAATEAVGLPAANPNNANTQETRWACYAWPLDYASTGYRCFVVTQQGEVYQASNEVGPATGFYSSPAAIPPPGAAFVPNGGREQNLDSRFPRPGEVSADGQSWAQAGGG